MLNAKKYVIIGCIALSGFILTACSSKAPPQKTQSSIFSHKSLNNSNAIINRLNAQQKAWQGTRYRLGGMSKQGIDCSGFTQLTFRELFGIEIPRTTTDQSKYGKKVAKSDLRSGDLVFFKTGRGPNGKHVGIYVKDGKFLHASTKGGVIYSRLDSPYWSKTYWQARRL